MDTPTYNAEGMQVYKPQPGEYWKHGLKFRESYGGIVAEINDIIQQAGGVPGTYPSNFAGIIAALNELGKYITEGDRPAVGPYPPGWEIIVNPDGSIDGNWQVAPADGSLWFDTRQGRLFVALDGEYWQTNGGDGLAHVSDSVPTNPPVIGSTWFDTVYEVLYVYVGGDDELWQVVKGAGEASLTTATLPLSIARSAFNVYDPTIIPDVPIENMEVQKDFNEYIYASLLALDRGIVDTRVIISDTVPTENLYNGTLWYDSSALEMSIYYEDDDGNQWVPTAVSYPFDDALATIRSSVVAETTAREYAIAALLSRIDEVSAATIPDIDAIQLQIIELENHVTNHPVEVDLTGYVTIETLNSNVSNLVSQITSVDNSIPDLADYVTSSMLTDLETVVSTLPTTSEVNALISAAAPDLSSYVAQSDIDTSISAITTEYLPRAGGTVSGSFIVNKPYTSEPAFDFSSEKWYSNLTHKYATNAADNSFVSFGTNDNLYEYAWDFTSNEDFCWVFNSIDKVFSIAKDGPACSNLFIGDFQANTNDGRVIINKIDVKDRLTTYQTAFENVRQAVSNSTDYNTLRSGLLTALAIV